MTGAVAAWWSWLREGQRVCSALCAEALAEDFPELAVRHAAKAERYRERAMLLLAHTREVACIPETAPVTERAS